MKEIYRRVDCSVCVCVFVFMILYHVVLVNEGDHRSLSCKCSALVLALYCSRGWVQQSHSLINVETDGGIF